MIGFIHQQSCSVYRSKLAYLSMSFALDSAIQISNMLQSFSLYSCDIPTRAKKVSLSLLVYQQQILGVTNGALFSAQ